VRPIQAGHDADQGKISSSGWLLRHRGGLGSCLPKVLVLGSQRSGLASLHTLMKRGWYSQLKVAAGERDLHFFSMDNRYKEGLLQYQKRFHPNSTRLRECGGAQQHGIDISSTYFDYPKAPARIFAILPWSRVTVVLRPPLERMLSAFNFRWLTWLCGKALWGRPDCWAALTSEEVVRANQVGPFQMHAALKLYRSCTDQKGVPRLGCLQKDYVSKLRNKSLDEIELLQGCEPHETTLSSAAEWEGCLGLRTLTGPKQIRKAMEDSAFIWRSMYAVHLQGWLELFPARQLGVADPASLWASKSSLHRLIGFTSPSLDAQESGAPRELRENSRRYIVRRAALPKELIRKLAAWLRPYNCRLGGLLARHGLGGSGLADVPWLEAELREAQMEGVEGAPRCRALATPNPAAVRV